MTTMVFPTESTMKSVRKTMANQLPPLKVAVHIDTEVLHPEVARRKANVWLLLYAGHLLRADHPELIWEDDVLLWRYDVVLTSPHGGDVGKIGKIQVDAKTGEALATEGLYEKLLANARILLAYQKNPPVDDEPNQLEQDEPEEEITNAVPVAVG